MNYPYQVKVEYTDTIDGKKFDVTTAPVETLEKALYLSRLLERVNRTDTYLSVEISVWVMVHGLWERV